MNLSQSRPPPFTADAARNSRVTKERYQVTQRLTQRITRLEEAVSPSGECLKCGGIHTGIRYVHPETGDVWHEEPTTACEICGQGPGRWIQIVMEPQETLP